MGHLILHVNTSYSKELNELDFNLIVYVRVSKNILHGVEVY